MAALTEGEHASALCPVVYNFVVALRCYIICVLMGAFARKLVHPCSKDRAEACSFVCRVMRRIREPSAHESEGREGGEIW